MRLLDLFCGAGGMAEFERERDEVRRTLRAQLERTAEGRDG